ncbi:MAG TPA: hypothetical protein VLK33_05925 [Terriglobales bacterium]|nr:hypothetical protein [Terriglobales bacterium]
MPVSVDCPPAPTRLWVQLARIVVIAFLLRVCAIFIIHSYRLDLSNDESAHIAAALASGKGFSNPFGPATGPTAWLGPAYPFFLSRIFAIFGSFTRASVIVALIFNCAFSALTCLPTFFIARYTFGLRIAKQAAWASALLPYIMYWGIRWVWDTSLSALLFALLFMLTLQLGQLSTLRKWILYGALWGLAGLTNTAQLAFLPFAGSWICYQQFKQRKPFFVNATAGAIIFFLVVTPWIWRDYAVFHKFIPIRGNFGVEFHLGNTDNAMGIWQVWLHPTQNVLEFKQYRQMGEVAYVQAKLQQTKDFIHRNPRHFAFLCLAHFVYYWSGPPHSEKYPGIYELKTALFLASSVFAFWGLGIALRKKLYGAELFLLLLLSYPSIYYITFPHPRYRHPIDALLLILIVFFCSQYRSRTDTLANRTDMPIA